MQFSAKKLQNNPNLRVGAPPSGKSWIHRLKTVHALVSVVTTRWCSQKGGPQMKKLEQVSSDHHQMSLLGREVPKCTSLNRCPVITTRCHQQKAGPQVRSDVGGGCPTWPFPGGSYHVAYPMMHLMLLPHYEQIDTYEKLPSRNFVGGR